MTHIQVEYNKLLETQRSNKRNEQLTEYRDTQTVRLREAELSEASRHNRATESVALGSLNETIRANKALEAWRNASLAETARHNQAGESISLMQANEVVRSNRARESLTAEAQAEVKRSNLARELETNRANQAQEAIRSRANDISMSSVAQTGRSIDESIRSHRASEDLTRQSQALTARGLEETERHNKRSELVSLLNTGLSAISTFTGGVKDLTQAGLNASRTLEGVVKLYGAVSR